jgi:hypothetical protein
MKDHTCRIVREASLAGPSWALYWDGAYQDRFESTRSARAVGLGLCSRRRSERVEVSVEDDAGRRLSTERLMHEPDA